MYSARLMGPAQCLQMASNICNLWKQRSTAWAGDLPRGSLAQPSTGCPPASHTPAGRAQFGVGRAGGIAAPGLGCCSSLQSTGARVRNPCFEISGSSQAVDPMSHQPHQQVPVHGELGHEGDIGGVRKGQELVLQEEQVDAVLREVLPAEIVAGIILVQLLQRLLQLRRSEGEREREPHGELGGVGGLRGVSAHPPHALGSGAETPSPSPGHWVGWGDWHSQRAPCAAGSRRTPGRSGRGCERTPRACSSPAASWASSSGSPEGSGVSPRGGGEVSGTQRSPSPQTPC